MHRQINQAHGSGLLLQKSKPRAKARATPRPLMPCGRACATRTGDRSVPVRVEDLMQKDGAAQEWCTPSLALAGQLGRLVCGKDVQRARRRSLCSRCSPLVSEPRMPVSSHAPEHVMVMLTWARVCVSQTCDEDSGWRVWRRIKGCNVFQGRTDTGCARGAREKRVRQRLCVERERLDR